MSFTGGTNLGSAYGVIKIGSELKGITDASKSLSSFEKQATSSAKKISAQFKAIGDSAKKLGTILSVGITTPIVAAAKQAIGAASDLNEAISATNVVFGDAADGVQAFAKTTADAFGISETAANEAAVQYAVFGKQSGLTGDALASFSEKLVENSADLASFFNKDPSETLNAIRSGLAGETEPLRNLGIIIDENTIKQTAYNNGIAEQGAELTQGQKVLARYLAIQEQMGAASGDFARTQDGLANSTRRFQALLGEVSAEFGQVMLPTVINVMHRLIDFLKAVKDLSPEMQKLVVTIGIVAAAIGPALLAFGAFMNILSKVGAAAAILTGPIGLIAAAVAGLYIAWRNNWFNIQGIVEKVIGTVTDIIDKFLQFFEHGTEKSFDPFKAALRALIRILQEPLGEDNPVVRALQGILRNGEKLAAWITNQFVPQMAKMANALLHGNFDQAGALFAKIAEDVKGGWDRTVGPFLQELAEFGKDALGGLINGVKQQDWDAIGDQLGTSIQAGLAKLSQFGAWVLDAIKGVGSGGGGTGAGLVKAQQIGSELTTWLSDRFSEVDWEKLGNDLISGAIRAVGIFLDFQKWRFEKLLQIGQFIVDRVAEVKWDDVGQKLLDVWRPAWDAFMNGVKTEGAKIAGSVLDAVKNAPWDTVGQQANDSLQGALAFLNQLGTWIKEQIAGINWDDVGSFIADKVEGAVNGIYALIRLNLQTLRDFGAWVRDELIKASYADVNKIVNDKGAEIFTSLVTGVKSKLNDLKVFVQGLSSTLQGWLQGASTYLLTRGQEIVDGLRHGFQDFWNNKFTPVFKGLIGALSNPDLFGDAITGAINAGGAFIEGLRHGMVDWFNNHLGPEFLDKLPQMITDTLSSLPGKLSDAGKAAIQGLWDGMLARLNQLKTDFDQWIKDNIPDFSSWAPPGTGVLTGQDPAGDARNAAPSGTIDDQSFQGGVKSGEAQVEGHIQGIENKTADGEKASADFIQSTIDSAAQQQESASPSKVFARLGASAGEGYVNAINAFQHLAQEAGAKLAESADTGASSAIDNIKNKLGDIVSQATSAFGKVAEAVKSYGESAVQSQTSSDSKRAASAEQTTAKMTDEEVTRAAAAAGFGDDAAAETAAQQEKRLQAEHDYARASIENERTRVKAIRDANVELDHSLRDLTVQRAQTERTLSRDLASIESDRVETAKQFETQLTDLAAQRNDIETQAAQDRADIEKNLQEQLSSAEAQFNDTQQQNLEAQQQVRAELAKQLEEAAQAWKDADAAAVEAINKIKESLKATLQQGREEFNRLMRDMDTSSGRTEEDFQRNLEDLNIQRSRINADLQAALVDPSLSPEQRAQARIDAARQLEDLDRRQQDIEIDHQRAVQDAETARHDAEIKHKEEEKAARDAAHQQIIDQKNAEKQAEKDYHDRRMELENDAAERIGGLQDDLSKAASDLHTAQSQLRDDATKQIDDLAKQEASSMADLAKKEQEIYDNRFKAFQDLETRKTAAFKTAEQDRTVIAREEQKARDLDARTQDQAERDAARDQRKALRQLNSAEDPTDSSLAQKRGEDFGTAQGKGTATGIENAQNLTHDAGEKIASSAETGYTSATDPKAMGTTWANSVISGMLSRLGGAQSAGNQLATAAEDGFRDASQMASPSKVGLALGRNFGGSIGLGILSQRQDIANSIGRLVGPQSLVRAGIGSMVAQDQGRAISALPGASGGQLVATVVIQDQQMRSFILGTAIAPMIGSRDRVSAGGIL